MFTIVLEEVNNAEDNQYTGVHWTSASTGLNLPPTL